jgi:NADPH:quinone reductase-like Zn-dependent oxidoreductase
MKAIVYRRYGPPEVLRLEEVERPIPGADEVLLKVHAASVNPYDWHFIRGAPAPIRIMTGLRTPKFTRVGADVAGHVEAVGKNVTRFRAGDAVFGTCKGSFAEFACTVDSTLAMKPEHVTFQQAAAVPIAALTALQGLRDKAKVQPGHEVLINGAAGGVGTFAVQIAKSLDAVVTGVCSTQNTEMVQSIGADYVIDYTRQDVTNLSQRYDIIFDLVGNHKAQGFCRVMKREGTYVGAGGGGPEKRTIDFMARTIEQIVVSWFVSQKLVGLLAKINKEDLALLSDLMESKQVTPVIDRCYPLADLPEAIRYVEQGHARGKVVIAVV